MMPRVSLASPFSVRVQLALNSRSRTLRLASEVSSGCWVVFCSGRTYLPFSPRALAASAADAISASLNPAKSDLLSSTSPPALVPASSFCWNDVSSEAACLLIAISRVLPA